MLRKRSWNKHRNTVLSVYNLHFVTSTAEESNKIFGTHVKQTSLRHPMPSVHTLTNKNLSGRQGIVSMFFKGLFRRLRWTETSVQVVCTESTWSICLPHLSTTFLIQLQVIFLIQEKTSDSDMQIMNFSNNICTYQGFLKMFAHEKETRLVLSNHD